MIKKIALGAALAATAGLAVAMPAQADTGRVGVVIIDAGDNLVAAGAELESQLLFNELDANIDIEQYGEGDIDYDIDFEIEGELSEDYSEGFSAEYLDDVFEELTENGPELSDEDALAVVDALIESGLIVGFLVD